MEHFYGKKKGVGMDKEMEKEVVSGKEVREDQKKRLADYEAQVKELKREASED